MEKVKNNNAELKRSIFVHDYMQKIIDLLENDIIGDVDIAPYELAQKIIGISKENSPMHEEDITALLTLVIDYHKQYIFSLQKRVLVLYDLNKKQSELINEYKILEQTDNKA